MYDIRYYLNANVIEYKEAHGEIRINCPFCDDTNFHMYVNCRKSLFHCFKCDQSGSILQLLGKLNEIYQSSVPLQMVDTVPEEKEQVTYETIDLPAGYQSVLEEGPGIINAYAYLRKRNISDSEIKLNKIGYTHFGKYAGRVIFPIYQHGELVSYIGRAVTDTIKPKVLTPLSTEAYPPSNFLYQFDTAKYFPGVILTEGVFSCLSTPIVDYRYAPVATFGKHLTESQKKLLFSSNFQEIIFAWDHDAEKEIIKYALELTTFFDVKVVWFPDDNDPNDYGPEAMVDLVRSAQPFSRLSSLRLVSATISALAEVMSPVLQCISGR